MMDGGEERRVAPTQPWWVVQVIHDGWRRGKESGTYPALGVVQVIHGGWRRGKESGTYPALVGSTSDP